MGYLKALDHVPDTIYAKSGEVIFHLIQNEFKRNNSVEISFKDVDVVTTAFVNKAFVQLLDYHDLKYIIKKLKITNSKKQINGLIKSRLIEESKKNRFLMYM